MVCLLRWRWCSVSVPVLFSAAYRCSSVPFSAAYRCSSVPFSAAYRCSSVPFSAAYRCSSVPFSAAYRCSSVPFSAAYRCSSVPFSAAYRCSAVPFSAAYRCSSVPFSAGANCRCWCHLPVPVPVLASRVSVWIGCRVGSSGGGVWRYRAYTPGPGPETAVNTPEECRSSAARELRRKVLPRVVLRPGRSRLARRRRMLCAARRGLCCWNVYAAVIVAASSGLDDCMARLKRVILSRRLTSDITNNYDIIWAVLIFYMGGLLTTQ